MSVSGCFEGDFHVDFLKRGGKRLSHFRARHSLRRLISLRMADGDLCFGDMSF